MNLFYKDGHLTDAALTALVQGEPLSQLDRVEISEHLAYCDLCLQRYTDLLVHTELLVPEKSCQASLWTHVRQRTIRLLTSRYATAAAAVALALTVLWGGQTLPLQPSAEKMDAPGISESAESLPEQWDSALKNFSGSLRGLFDQISSLRQDAERNARS